MKKIIDLGRIKFYKNSNFTNRATLQIELKETEKGEEFTASGTVWEYGGRGCIIGGQCLEEMAEFFKEDEIFQKVYKFWKLYHLNGMHPECEHQHALKWHEIANEKIIFNIYRLRSETLEQKRLLENKILKMAKNGETITTTKEERILLNLKWEIRTDEELSENLKPFYLLTKTEEKAKGWTTYEKESKSGILSKPCPICGYKYGSGWNFFKIPKEDLKEIKKLFEGAKND